MDENRLIDLETRLSYQEDTLRVLSDALREQQTRIEVLEKSLRKLAERFVSQHEEPGVHQPQDERPPHY